jgi:hypothetical protein
MVRPAARNPEPAVNDADSGDGSDGVGPQSVLIKPPGEKTRQFTLLGAGNYEGDLTFALAEQGFQVKPIAVTQAVTELESDTRIVSYKKAGFRYALKLSVIDDYAWLCAFSGAHRVNATLSVVDIGTNETLAVIKFCFIRLGKRT